MVEPHRAALRLCRSYLVENIGEGDLVAMCTTLINNAMISSSELDSVTRQGTVRDKVRQLIDILERKERNAFDLFCTLSVDVAAHLENILAGALEEPAPIPSAPPEESLPSTQQVLQGHRNMELKCRYALIQCRPQLVERLYAAELLDHLRANDRFTLKESNEIQACEIEQDKARKFLDILETKSQEVYEFFLRTIELLPHNEDIVKLLNHEMQREFPDEELDLESILAAADVPMRTTNYVERRNLIDQIRQGLKALIAKPGFVLLHGMTGSGKSVLAAEALRSREIVELFQARNGRKGILYIRLENENVTWKDVCERLLMKIDPDSKVKGDRVREKVRVLINNYPPWLIVLDNVFVSQPKLLHAEQLEFLKSCRVLCTSQDSCAIERGENCLIEIEPGFSPKESLEAFSRCTGIAEDAMPSKYKEVHDLCKGLPLAICAIGGMIGDPNGGVTWEVCAEMLKCGDVSQIQKRGAHTPVVTQAFEVCIDKLDDCLMKMLEYFAIFEKGALLSPEIFSVILEKDKTKVQQCLELLVNVRSLVQRPKKSGYMIHDLVHTVLNDRLKEKVKDLHATVLKQYLKKCNAEWWKLDIEDKTAWWHLTKHMREQGDETYYSLRVFFTDLRSIEALARRTDFFHVLGEMQNLCNLQGGKPDLIAFQKFLQSYGHKITPIMQEVESVHLSNKRQETRIQKQFLNLIQVALLTEPRDSPVYAHAKMTASDKFWLNSFELDGPEILDDRCWSQHQICNGPFDFSHIKNLIAIPHFKGFSILCGSTGKTLLTTPTNSDPWMCKFSNGGLHVMTYHFHDNTVVVWEFPESWNHPQCDPLKVIKTEQMGNEFEFGAFSFSPDDRELLVVPQTGHFLRIPLHDEAYPATQDLGYGGVTRAVFSDDGNVLAVVFQNSHLSVYVYEPPNLREVEFDPPHNELLNTDVCIPFPTELKQLLLLKKSSMEIFNIDDQVKSTLCKKEDGVEYLYNTLSKCGEIFVTSTLKPPKIFVCNVSTASCISIISPALHRINVICKSPELVEHSHKILVFDGEGTLKMLNVSPQPARSPDKMPRERVLQCWSLRASDFRFLLACIKDNHDIVLKFGVCSKDKLEDFKEHSKVADERDHPRFCLNDNATELVVAVGSGLKRFEIHLNYDESDITVESLKPFNGERNIEHLAFLGDRLLIVDATGSVKVEKGGVNDHEYEEKVKLENSKCALKYLPKERYIVIADAMTVTVVPLSGAPMKMEIASLFPRRQNERIDIRLAFDATERYLAVFGSHKTAHIFKFGQTELKYLCPIHDIDVADVTFLPEHSNILCTTSKHNIAFYKLKLELANVKALGKVYLPVCWGLLSWTPNGEYLAVCTTEYCHLFMIEYTNDSVLVQMMWSIDGNFHAIDDILPVSLSNTVMAAADANRNLSIRWTNCVPEEKPLI